jgi:hypothetical protein
MKQRTQTIETILVSFCFTATVGMFVAFNIFS